VHSSSICNSTYLYISLNCLARPLASFKGSSKPCATSTGPPNLCNISFALLENGSFAPNYQQSNMRAMAYYVFSNWYACAVVSHSKLCCILMRCMRMQSAQAAVWKVQDISARDSSSSCSRSCCAGVHTLAACLCIAHRDVCVRRLCDAAFTNCINTCIKDAKRPWVTAIPKDISCQTIIYTLRPLQS
jgi:hypothetical protein